jgi:hypothetical protein
MGSVNDNIRDLTCRHMLQILEKKKLTTRHLKKLERLSKIVFDVNLYVKVDIYFTAVGIITIPTEEEILSIMDEIQRNPNGFRLIA